jgi:adenylate kinase
MKLILLGPPGVGKGTQAQRMAQEFGIPQISTGDILRDAVNRKTDLGKLAQSFMMRGELVPDEVILDLIQDRLFGADAPQGYILDGFPRTLAQAEGLQELFKMHDGQIDWVILLKAGEDLIIKRLSSRRTCRNCQVVYNLITKPPKVAGICDNCGSELFQREDDKPDTIKNRLQVYKKTTEPLIKFYRGMGILITIDAAGQPEDVLQEIKHKLEVK